MHNNLVVHRDLKPENILLDDNLNIKICDFGLSNLMPVGDFMNSVCGSPHYTPPELHKNQKYIGPEVDIWALGVILYAMVCGCLPWSGDTLADQISNLIEGRYRTPNFLSNDCKLLLSRMLAVDPKQRATIQEIRQHQFTNKGWNSLPPSNLPIRRSLQPEQIDPEILLQLVSLGFEKAELISDLKQTKVTKRGVVLYYLFYDYKARQTRKMSQRILSRSASASSISRTVSVRSVKRTDSAINLTSPPKEVVVVPEVDRRVSYSTVQEKRTKEKPEAKKSKGFMKMIGFQLSKLQAFWK